MSSTKISGDFFDVNLEKDSVHLVIADFPYGGIVKKEWDKNISAENYLWGVRKFEEFCVPGAAAYVFGGTGTPGNRVFFEFLSRVEADTNWVIANVITWKKRRGFGTQTNYLYTREEIAYLVLGNPKKPRVFNVPYLEEKRGYSGWNAKYPAHSEYLRRSNVWTDVGEIMRNMKHVAQKPARLFEIMSDTSTNPGDTIVIPFAGSGEVGNIGESRNVIMIEKSWEPGNSFPI